MREKEKMKTADKNKKRFSEEVMVLKCILPNYVRLADNFLAFFMPVNPKSVLIGKADGGCKMERHEREIRLI